jgi:hypothetical protein
VEWLAARGVGGAAGWGAGFEHAVQGGAADAEAVGGADLVAVAAEKDIEDMVVDDVVETLDAGFDRAGTFLLGELAERREMRGVDDTVGAIWITVWAVGPGQLDDALQFADVAGPVVGLKLGNGAAIEGSRRMAALGSAAAQDGAGDQRDVFEPGAQGGDEDLHGGDQAIEFAVELASAGQGTEIAAGGEDHARTFRADAGAGESLEDLAELNLFGGGELVDAADEEGAAWAGKAGEEFGAVVRSGIGDGLGPQRDGLQDRWSPVGVDQPERARRRAEAAEGGANLGGDAGQEFEERRRSVGRKGTVGVGGDAMEGKGDGLLAGAGLAGDERYAEVRRDAAELGAEGAHGEAVAGEADVVFERAEAGVFEVSTERWSVCSRGADGVFVFAHLLKSSSADKSAGMSGLAINGNGQRRNGHWPFRSSTKAG